MAFGPRHRAELALLVAAAIWGLTFPLISAALSDMDTPRFLAARFGLAVAVFAGVLLVLRPSRASLRAAALPGLLLGAIAFVAYWTQTVGLESAPAGRIAFVTGTNVVLVPLLAPVFRAGRPKAPDLAAAAVATAGLFLLTDPGGPRFGVGDLWGLGCALSYATYMHVLHKVLARRGPDEVPLAFFQVAGLAVLALLWLPSAPDAAPHWTGAVFAALAFTALFATVGTFWLQTRFQGRTTPERAALLFAMEPVFGAGLAWWMLGETFTLRELGGAGLILAAVVGIQVVPALWARAGRGAAVPAADQLATAPAADQLATAPAVRAPTPVVPPSE